MINTDLNLTTISVSVISALGGGGLSALYTWWGKRSEIDAARERARIDTAHDQISILQGEVNGLRTEIRVIEAEARQVREEAWRVQDRARLAVSLAASYISLLRAHIAARRPPPPPPMPDELERYIQSLLWSSQMEPANDGRAPPADPAPK